MSKEDDKIILDLESSESVETTSEVTLKKVQKAWAEATNSNETQEYKLFLHESVVKKLFGEDYKEEDLHNIIVVK